MLDNKILHDCGARQWLQCARPDCHYVHTPTSPSLSPTSKAATGAAPEVSKPQLDFFEDCSVVDLAQKINLNLSGIVKSIQKSLLKEPTTDNVLKEATKNSTQTKNTSQKRATACQTRSPKERKCPASPADISACSPCSCQACTSTSPPQDQAVHSSPVQTWLCPLLASALH